MSRLKAAWYLLRGRPVMYGVDYETIEGKISIRSRGVVMANNRHGRLND